ncbi:hypothetical protein [Helicobacter marmotae]|uniref:Uncharacterized protein n=1 Tax=Helicobacter marmotae TaxID=152490 RepID=A0A3D8I6U6_9HELI|nr:hypothetical protein [Helicobacter marmotae]RDU60261.1 hypothetical protein CQA63_03330 [Helicobacter marmotae]
MAKKKALWYFVGSIIALLIVLGGGYYYMKTLSSQSLEDMTQSIESALLQKQRDIDSQNSALEAKERQIELLKAQNEEIKQAQQSVPAKLRYFIKPKEKVVAHCKDSKIGRWDTPKHCLDELSNAVVEMKNEDNTIVAFEVSGIVDTRPYAGLSPELKQEGLASFRAKEAINIIAKTLPDIAVFEGLSQQKNEERGFIVRAFYVQ